ncbi:hypothetical protein Bca4012_036838 [Brassica carinata]
MSADYDDVKKNHVFTHTMAIAENKLKFSGKLVDSFICRQLITSKMHEKWFVFARTPLRFSLQEYHAVTGLKISREGSTVVVKWKNDGDEVDLLVRDNGVVMGRDEKVNIPHMYIKMVMDPDKLRKFHWDLHSYDLLLSSIEKARTKLGKKDSYIFEGFFYAFQIWLMEAIPDFGEICGRRVSDSFRGPRCDNWKGVAKVCYQDIIELEDSFTDQSDLFSVISVTGNGDVFLHYDYTRKGEMEDERVNLLLDMIRNKFEWSNTEWPAIEPEETEIEETNTKDIDSEAGKSVDDTNVVEDEEISLVKVVGKGRRKVHDEGAETRKKNTQMANMERIFTARMGKMESEVSQLRDALWLGGEGSNPSKSEAENDLLKSKGDQAPYKSKSNQAPPKSKGDQAAPKSIGDQPTGTKKFIECHALGLELSVVNDDNIKEARLRLLWDLWEPANDQELVDRMSKYEPPACLPSTYQEIL